MDRLGFKEAFMEINSAWGIFFPNSGSSKLACTKVSMMYIIYTLEFELSQQVVETVGIDKVPLPNPEVLQRPFKTFKAKTNPS